MNQPLSGMLTITRPRCPICGAALVRVVGPKDSPLLLIGAYPGMEEVRSGIPWVGRAGEVLHTELRLVGINYSTCRVTNIWLHSPLEEKDPRYKEELDWHFNQAIKELNNPNRRAVLLMGSLPSALLLDEAVSDVEGLLMTSPLIPKHIQVCVPSRNPASLLDEDAVVGPVREAFKVFAEKSRPYWRV